ncbi:MAG: riboflavin biosynthesis protein RibF [bacterium]|jgi:riboflavin kinase/FMN adenylyltransferase
MKIVRHMSGLSERKRPICLAVGFFDGVHLGHQNVLRRTIEHARKIGGEAWAMTFDPHPLKILNPDAAPRMLTTSPHKLHLLQQFGLDGCLLIPFNRKFAAIQAASFLKKLERDIPSLAAIFMGDDWHFGHKGQGNHQMLCDWAAHHPGISIHQIEAVRRGGQPISSTRIRNTVISGKLGESTALLGRPYSILGTVRHGNQIGRKIGYPTANLAPCNEAHPPTGVYAVQTIFNGKSFPGMVNFGFRPTVAPVKKPLVEVYLLDTKQNLYGRQLEVFFLRKLRHEKKYPDLKTLIHQIRKDEIKARQTLASASVKKLWIGTLQKWHPDIIVNVTNKSIKLRKERD